MDREKHIVAWYDAAVKANHNVIWRCESGLVAGKAGPPQVGYYLFDLWGALAANAVQFGSGAAPTAGSFSAWAIPQDNFAPPRKLFYFDRPKWLMQVFPSLNNPDALYWLRLPQHQPRGGFISVIGNPDTNYRFPYGWWFEGKDSDIDDPTNAGEFWVPPKCDLEVSVLNTTNVAFRPQCLYIMNQFSVLPYDPTTESGKRTILGMLRNSIPFRDGSIGGNNDFAIDPESFRTYFGVYPVQWDGVKASYTDSAGNKIIIGEV